MGGNASQESGKAQIEKPRCQPEPSVTFRVRLDRRLTPPMRPIQSNLPLPATTSIKNRRSVGGRKATTTAPYLRPAVSVASGGDSPYSKKQPRTTNSHIPISSDRRTRIASPSKLSTRQSTEKNPPMTQAMTCSRVRSSRHLENSNAASSGLIKAHVPHFSPTLPLPPLAQRLLKRLNRQLRQVTQSRDRAAILRLRFQPPWPESRAAKNARARNCSGQNAKRKPLSGSSASLKKRSSAS